MMAMLRDMMTWVSRYDDNVKGHNDEGDIIYLINKIYLLLGGFLLYVSLPLNKLPTRTFILSIIERKSINTYLFRANGM